MDALLQRTWVRRALPLVTAVLAAGAVGALFGRFASVFGFAAGFLLGAFALGLRNLARARGHRHREATMHAEALGQLRAMGALGPMRLAAPPQRRSTKDLNTSIDTMEQLATSDLGAAIEFGASLRVAYPKSATLLARLAIYERSAGRDVDARATVAEAFAAALAIGATRVALDLYDDFAEELDRIEADPAVFEALAYTLAEGGRALDSERCVALAAQLRGDADRDAAPVR